MRAIVGVLIEHNSLGYSLETFIDLIPTPSRSFYA